MNAFARPVTAAALVLVLAACGSDDSGSDSGNAPAPSSSGSSASTTPTPADETVASVMLRRSGGLKGEPLDRAFVVGHAPPQGFTAAEQEEVIAGAQQLVDAEITLPDVPDNTCCDRYTYVVVIGFADGTSTTYTALDGEGLPGAFSDLLGRLS
jgi:hypothetical protein